MPRIGDIVAGKYRLDSVVGKGGMGVVYGATHLDLDRPVAVKFVHVDTTNASDTARLLKEARSIALLSSEHVARVFDAGVIDHKSYVVLELLEGTELESLITKNGPLPIADACEYAIQACHGLGNAHGHGIVHRDVKPSNLFLTKDASGLPCIKLIDFGIAKAHGSSSSEKISWFRIGLEPPSATRENALIGSPVFMSPEQVASNEVDLTTDIWSLGVTLYFLLSGIRPFDGANLAQLFTQIQLGGPRVSLRERVPAVSPELEAIVLRCLEKEKSLRFPSAAALARALLPFAHERARWVVERLELLSTRSSQNPEPAKTKTASGALLLSSSPRSDNDKPLAPGSYATTESTATLDIAHANGNVHAAQTRSNDSRTAAFAMTEPHVSVPKQKPMVGPGKISRSPHVWLAMSALGVMVVSGLGGLLYRSMYHAHVESPPTAVTSPYALSSSSSSSSASSTTTSLDPDPTPTPLTSSSIQKTDLSPDPSATASASKIARPPSSRPTRQTSQPIPARPTTPTGSRGRELPNTPD